MDRRRGGWAVSNEKLGYSRSSIATGPTVGRMIDSDF